MNKLVLLPVNSYYLDVLEYIYKSDNKIDEFCYHGNLVSDHYCYRVAKEKKKEKILIPGLCNGSITYKDSIIEYEHKLTKDKNDTIKTLYVSDGCGGKDTLLTELILKNDDILFLDFGPIFEDWEADFGRTYVVGNDPVKIKLKADIENAWIEGKNYFKNQTEITGAQLYIYCNKLALKFGWEFGGEIAGHIIGQYPHEKLEKEDKTNYIHPENHSIKTMDC